MNTFSKLVKGVSQLCLALIILGFIFISSAQAAEAVRVAVVEDAKEINLKVRSSYEVLSLNTNKKLYSAKRLWDAKVVPSETGIKIGKINFKIYGIRIQPSKSPSIYVNGRKFRGAIDIIRQKDNTLLIINHVDIEDYICGVLYHEVAPWWPMEALKAQAIAVRTYALYQASHNKNKEYDLVSTIYSQVYGGRTSEKGRTNKATRKTKGEVLTYKNKIFPTFFHATCAGHTESANNLWNIDIPPLGGRECKFCERSPHFRWKKKLKLTDIENSLKKSGFETGTIEKIEIVDKNISGRITELKIFSKDKSIKVAANRFRLACGPNGIRSTNFDLQLENGKVYFNGIGWGHGVGMCQWGAFFMSKKRFNAKQILNFYYPESKVKKLDQIKNAQGEFETF